MKKILLLLVAACCLFVSCEKEGGNSSVDGTTWKGSVDDGTVKLILKDGIGTLMSWGSTSKTWSLYDSQAYKVKGNKITFNDKLKASYSYFKEGTFNSDKSRLTLIAVSSSGGREEREFIRVVE